ncbi:MAG: YifB family Mg chelatase-like AAA ATPase [Candidatus Omnitrophica bacterium]|nr:YifB family Mg chelatase-like AAA ATPase [Candidatus Omnitrophota bacterium]
MLSKIYSSCVIGINAYAIEVEVDVANGMPCFSVVGLPDTSIRESRDRIRAAIKNSGYTFPSNKITVNLSPADVKKEGAGFDLPIAVGILAALGVIPKEALHKTVICGELSLDGRLKGFRGALPVAISLKDRFRDFIFPAKSAGEASNVEGVSIYGAKALKEVVEHLKGINPLGLAEKECASREESQCSCERDMKDVKGQEHVKRGLEVAASGSHNMLLLGPPGSGKSMLARRFPGILPDLDIEEALETTKIYSIAGELDGSGLLFERPVRMPHHTISYAAMAGGGSFPMPGEISLANNGVLFLDELPEFRRDVLETLRQPLESGEITVTRIQQSLRYPSRFILMAAMNPCPCGYFTDPHKRCNCTPNQIQRYLSKISGPLLDRIDIHLEVPRLNYEQMSKRRSGESSEEIKTRVVGARCVQKERFAGKPAYLSYNAYMNSSDLEEFCVLSGEAEELLKTAILELGISARAYDKILKISRTIADMERSKIIETHHISEAIGYRCLDRGLWA